MSLSLNLNLSNKNLFDVEEIFNSISNPQTYNSIDLTNNFLTFLPKNISLFKNIHTLNLLNNKFIDYNSLSNILLSLPQLKNLNIDLSSEENAFIILSTLPGLITLNGQLTEENDVNDFNKEKKNDISLNEEMDEFEFIYKEINNEKFNKKFQEKLREEIDKINNNLDISNKLYNAIIVKSKLEIYSFILYEVLNLFINKENNNINNIDSFSKIINIVKDKLKYNQNILFELVMNDNNNNKINNINNNNKNTNNNFLKLYVTKENPSYEISNELSIIDSLDSLSTDKIKIMQKNNLIFLLDKIYEYKAKKNLDYSEAIIPFLIGKYGMKSLANFWYNKIIESINYYIDQIRDNFSEVYLTKLILEKKLDEFFYFKYKQNKKKFINYINNIKSLLKNKENYKFISYDEGIKLLIEHLDDILDDKNVINDFMECINKNKKKNLEEKHNDNNNNSINNFAQDFINILLEIYIKRRANQYNIFLTNFKIYDKDNDGFINKEEFIELIYSFKSEYMINNNKIITNLCSELFQKKKSFISLNNCIEILSKFNINNNKDIFEIILS